MKSQQINTELVSIKSVDQVLKYNEKVENFYTKIDSQKAAIKAKIVKLEEQKIALENALYQKEQEGLNHKEWKIKITSSEGLQEEIDFFSKVTHHATAVNADKFADGSYQKTVYKIDGKWYEGRIAIPATYDEHGNCNGMDESKTFFKVQEVEI